MKEDLEGCSSSKRARQAEDVGPSYSAFLSDEEEEPERVVGYGRSRGKQLMGDRDLALNFTPLRSLGYVDPGWEHGVAQDEKKKKVKCNYCGKVVSGGVNRFKQHLARIPGEVAPCNNAPEDVYLKIKENMKWHRTGRRQKWPYFKDQSTFYIQPNNGDKMNEQEEEALNQMSKERLAVSDRRLRKDLRMAFKEMSPHDSFEPLLKKLRLDSDSLNSPHSQTLPSYKRTNSKRGSGKRSRKEVVSAISKFFYHAGVPLQAADSQYFHSMLELVGQYGQGLVGPTSQLISGHLLQEEIATIRKNLVKFRAFWAITGCSIIADSWTDIEGRVLLNFVVSSPHGSYFVSSVDATDVVENALNLFKLLDKVVEEVGEENVVQVFNQFFHSSFSIICNPNCNLLVTKIVSFLLLFVLSSCRLSLRIPPVIRLLGRCLKRREGIYSGCLVQPTVLTRCLKIFLSSNVFLNVWKRRKKLQSLSTIKFLC